MPHDASLIDAAVSLQRLTHPQDRAFRTLSGGGERQRVLLARALVQQPQVLVLDEPTNQLDIRYQLSLLRFVREIGVTVVGALHDLNLAAMFCDRLCLMDGGRIVAQGDADEVLTERRIADVFGIDALIQRHPRTGTV
ncbi:ABC transporter ATP-binding protein [Mesobaculum littorinae]|uniref:ABC transporter ATP-binding protein n=1 Tax=Mesobaculum littorinae TaxID=2486419 RepID=UPI0019D46BE5|nr:ABC transporter ATP-binding protein [Mesobaculum littorinae]